MQRDAPEEFQVQIFQEIKNLEEEPSEEEMELLGKKHNLEKITKKGGMPKGNKGERSLLLKVESPVRWQSDLELRKSRQSPGLLKWRITKKHGIFEESIFGRYGGKLVECQNGLRTGEAC